MFLTQDILILNFAVDVCSLFYFSPTLLEEVLHVCFIRHAKKQTTLKHNETKKLKELEITFAICMRLNLKKKIEIKTKRDLRFVCFI